MATIVQHKKTNKKYFFLGVGYAAYKATRPSFFGGNLLPKEEEGTMKVVSVCDKEGKILWFDPEHLRVVKVDGVEISELNQL